VTLPLVPLRGEVWDVGFPRVGPHPAVVLTVNALRSRLSELTVVLVTGTPGPRTTHIPLGTDAGVTKYPESYVNVTSVHTVPLGSCRSPRGRLAAAELEAVSDAVRLVLGL
jgi:mRNA interferase MazF